MDTGGTWIDGDLLRCSFCGRAQKKVAKLVAQLERPEGGWAFQVRRAH